MTPPCCFAAIAKLLGGVGSPRPTGQYIKVSRGRGGACPARNLTATPTYRVNRINGFPLWGKLSPQVTDEGATSGHFPLIRRAGRATFPQRGKAFSVTKKSRCRCFHLHRRSYFFGVISLITLIRYFSDWSLKIIGTASYLLRSFLNPWLILRVHGSIPFLNGS